jgi:hypothetical protein
VALTLAETLTAVVVCAVLGAALLRAMRHVLLLTTRFSNHTLAWERGQNALSLLEPRVLHTALGLTWERGGEKFQRSFGAGSPSAPPPARWSGGPLQVWRGYPTLTTIAPEEAGVCRGRGIVLLYAVPSLLRAKTLDNAPVSMDEARRIELVPGENLTQITERLVTGDRTDLWSWVVFPLTNLPVHVKEYSGGRVTLQGAENSGLSATLFPYDEMHYLRGERFQVQHDRLYSENLRQSWTSLQPRLDGVLETWFEFTPSKRLLDAWILAAGGPAAFGRGARPPEWPADAPWRDAFERYDLAVVRASWLVRNF